MEYAATILAQLPFRTMSLQDRGLLYTMRLECWINERLPQEPYALAKVLGYSADEIDESLPAVMPFFKAADGFITCPELEDYREHLVERRRKQSQGGKHGAAITNSRHSHHKKAVDNKVASTSSSNPQLTRQGRSGSLVQPSAEKPSQNHLHTKKKSTVLTDNPFAREYKVAESCEAEAYTRASRGE